MRRSPVRFRSAAPVGRKRVVCASMQPFFAFQTAAAMPTSAMSTTFHFSFCRDWRTAPLAFWVHVPVEGTDMRCNPPAPKPVPHKGYLQLHVLFESHELLFSAPAQLEHFIDVLSSKPLPTSRQLSSRRGLPVGPNGHWLSRLPARLKSPRKRGKLVQVLRAVRAQVVQSEPSDPLEPVLFMMPSRLRCSTIATTVR